MAETRDLLFRFLGDAKDLNRAARSAKGDLDQVEDKAQKTSRAFGGLSGAVGGFVAAIGVGAVGRFAVDVAQLAEQAGIAAESAEKVLGPALEDFHDNLEDVRGTLGLNIGELDTLAAKFGLLTDGFGLTDEAQAEFIENLIRTGGELAAFRGNVGEAPEAIDAMAAAIRGEFDPLEQFGIKLSQAAINERALELAADPATAALSEQELQILAIQQLIAEKAEAAFGSLAEAQDSLAGKTNQANVALEDMKIELGEKLAPVMADALGFLVDLVDAMNGAPTEAGSFLRFLEDVGKAILAVADAVQGAIGWLDDLGDALNKGIGDWGRATFTRKDPGRDPSGKTDLRNATGPMGVRTVPGPQGKPVGIIAHGGEQIGNGLGGSNIYVTVNALDPRAAARAVVQALQQYERTAGPVPINTRQP